MIAPAVALANTCDWHRPDFAPASAPGTSACHPATAVVRSSVRSCSEACGPSNVQFEIGQWLVGLGVAVLHLAQLGIRGGQLTGQD